MRKITEEFFIRFDIDCDTTEVDLLEEFIHYPSLAVAVSGPGPREQSPEIVYRITPMRIVKAGAAVVETIEKTKFEQEDDVF